MDVVLIGEIPAALMFIGVIGWALHWLYGQRSVGSVASVDHCHAVYLS